MVLLLDVKGPGQKGVLPGRGFPKKRCSYKKHERKKLIDRFSFLGPPTLSFQLGITNGRRFTLVLQHSVRPHEKTP